MPSSSVDKFLGLMAKAENYHKSAHWQEKLRVLQEAFTVCTRQGFPEAEQRKRQVLVEIGGVRRRFGQYDEAAQVLQQALHSLDNRNPIVKAKILGELGVVYRHSNDFFKAREAFRNQYNLAYETSIEAEAELCRAIGNEGMSAYNISLQSVPPDLDLLEFAQRKLRERISRARQLRLRLLHENPKSRYVDMSKSWETIGMDRLSLCLVAAGRTAEAVQLAAESQRGQSSEDPTVRAFSRFFYGNALWSNGQRDEALQQWQAPLGSSASAMALCKEPALEHVEYIRLLAQAGVDFDSYDEQGFSALDHAVLSDNQDAKQMIVIILDAFRKKLRQALASHEPKIPEHEIESRIEEDIFRRTRQAQLRRQCRAILQEHLRPELRHKGSNTIQKLRAIYAKLLRDDPSKQEVLDGFHYVTYRDFSNHKRLPVSGDGLTKQFANRNGDTTQGEEGGEDPFIIFFSYRWIGRTSRPGVNAPDDVNNTQWLRMNDAIEDFLEQRPDVSKERVGLWLDCACIEQDNTQLKERGIDALPFAVTQCDALISLVDEQYYERAWCAVEVMLVRELVQSYHHHDWWEHVLDSPDTDRLKGSLRRPNLSHGLDTGNLKLTDEESDRPKIDFLVRQAKLLGRDDS